MNVKVREPLVGGVSSLVPLCRFWGPHSGGQTDGPNGYLYPFGRLTRPGCQLSTARTILSLSHYLPQGDPNLQAKPKLYPLPPYAPLSQNSVSYLGLNLPVNVQRKSLGEINSWQAGIIWAQLCSHKASSTGLLRELAAERDDVCMVPYRQPFLQPHFLLNGSQSHSYLRGEHSGTGPDAPADHWLGEAALLDAPADLIFLCTPYLQNKWGKIKTPQVSGSCFKFS